MINEFLTPHEYYSENNVKKNAISTYAMSFFFQVIDFCYNYFNYLLSYGVQEDTQFIFYPYNTRQHKESNTLQGFRKELIGGKIEMTNDLFRDQILYRIQGANHTTVGSYLQFESAREAKRKKERDEPGKQLFLVDRQNSILPI